MFISLGRPSLTFHFLPFLQRRYTYNMIHNMTERKGRAPGCRRCLRKVTIGLVLATCLLFATSAEAQTDCHMYGTERYVGYYKFSFIFPRPSIAYLIFILAPRH